MSTQIVINKQLVNYLQSVGYREDPIIDTLVKETKEIYIIGQYILEWLKHCEKYKAKTTMMF